jgi:hypothetical protein
MTFVKTNCEVFAPALGASAASDARHPVTVTTGAAAWLAGAA